MSTKYQIGYDGKTVNDRAKIVGDAIGMSRPRLAIALLLSISYFSTCSGINIPEKVLNRIRTVLPGLDINWFVNGYGEFNRDKIVIPSELLVLIDTKSSNFSNIFSDPRGEAAAVQYLQDHGVNVDNFVDKYGKIYPALSNYKIEEKNENRVESPTVPYQSQTASNLDALVKVVADQQTVIHALTAQIKSLQDELLKRQ